MQHVSHRHLHLVPQPLPGRLAVLPVPADPHGAVGPRQPLALWPRGLHAAQESIVPGDVLQRPAAGADQPGPLGAGELAHLVPEPQASSAGGLGVRGSLAPGAVRYHTRVAFHQGGVAF